GRLWSAFDSIGTGNPKRANRAALQLHCAQASHGHFHVKKSAGGKLSVAGGVAQGAGASGPPDTTASAKADIVKPCVIPLLKELTYCSLSSWSVSSRPLLEAETGINRATCSHGSRRWFFP